MNKTQYYVFHESKQMGPYSLDLIAEMVKKNELTLFDCLYDKNMGDWVLLMEYEQLVDQLKDGKSLAFSKTSELALQTGEGTKSENLPAHMVAEWYVLNNKNKFGPFSYLDIAQMLQRNILFEFDFVWYSGLVTWTRIADLDEFKPKNIRKLKEILVPEISNFFFRRRYRRVRCDWGILIHNKKSVWEGKGLEVGAGGVGITMENNMVIPGQTLYLHFKSGDGVPSFNAICEVVSKQGREGANEKNTSVRYGLKFTSISPKTQKLLHKFAKESKAASRE